MRGVEVKAVTESVEPPHPKKPRLAVQAFWLMTARCIGFVFALAMPLVIVRLFTQEEFGAYKQAFMVVNTAVITLPFSFVLSAFYFFPPVGKGIAGLFATHPPMEKRIAALARLESQLQGAA